VPAASWNLMLCERRTKRETLQVISNEMCMKQDYAKETSYFASYIELTPEMDVSDFITIA
jgi:hypothetical protein